uniref:Uncharacterized protein n=1 Tax=Globodera rostochiensis TaxID=31243 RepID=A0A914HVV6_GLORO
MLSPPFHCLLLLVFLLISGALGGDNKKKPGSRLPEIENKPPAGGQKGSNSGGVNKTSVNFGQPVASSKAKASSSTGKLDKPANFQKANSEVFKN